MERFRISSTGRERTSLVIIVLALLFLTGGLIKLQVFAHAELTEQSENNRIRVVPIIPRRGLVYDREGRIIIDNRASYTLGVVVAEMVKGVTLPNLAEVVSIDSAEIKKRIRRNMVSSFQPTPVLRDIPFEVVAILEEQAERFPGVTYQAERVRLYRDTLGIKEGDILRVEAFTGYVGDASQADLDRLKSAEYRPGSTIGKDGLEKEHDEILRGREGTAYIEVYASGQILGPYEDRLPLLARPGEELTLTIDLDIQRALVSAIDTFCCGAIIAMDPRDGGVLGMVSFPSYNANIFSSVIPDSLWRAISGDSSHPLLNRPIRGRYPPGSTVKFVGIGAGLELGIINEQSTFNTCPGGMQFGDRFFKCWKPAGHGALNGVHTLEESCDVFMYQLGLKIGIDGLSEYYKQCGFGQPTGIDLPGENAGLNPNSEWYDKHYGKNKWTRALVLNNVIGQGELLVTPLQLTQFFCGLANKGIVYRPHMVKFRIDAFGRVLETKPDVSFKLPFSKETMDYLYEGMRLVVEGEHGTASGLKNDRYSLGGKTGTVQNPHGENHSLFVGVAPLEAPEIVVCAIFENAGHGSEVAAVAVGRIIDAFMKKKLGLEEPLSVLPLKDSLEEGE